jgi:hypothetical protein
LSELTRFREIIDELAVVTVGLRHHDIDRWRIAHGDGVCEYANARCMVCEVWVIKDELENVCLNKSIPT